MRLTFPMSLVVPMAILGISTIQGTAAKCSDGLVNVVFNAGGYTKQRWEKIHSASNWLTFDFGLEDKQIPMLGNNKTAVQQAIHAVNGPNPPDFMLTFNEPDLIYGSNPPIVQIHPEDAARLIKPLLHQRGNHTKFIAPVPAFAKSNWLPEFFGNCSCQDSFSAYNVHVYYNTVEEAKNRINTFHQQWNDKPLWITEIAPHQDKGCPNPIPWDNSIKFMQDIYAWGQKIEWIHKIFWNSANEINCHDQNVAASFLLDFHNNPTPLLDPFNKLTCS